MPSFSYTMLTEATQEIYVAMLASEGARFAEWCAKGSRKALPLKKAFEAWRTTAFAETGFPTNTAARINFKTIEDQLRFKEELFVYITADQHGTG